MMMTYNIIKYIFINIGVGGWSNTQIYIYLLSRTIIYHGESFIFIFLHSTQVQLSFYIFRFVTLPSYYELCIYSIVIFEYHFRVIIVIFLW